MLPIVRDTPIDIWYEIFKRGLEEGPVNLRRRQEPPWLYLQVCKQWHTAVTAYQPFWTDVAIDVPEEFGESPVYATIVRNVLAWSSPYPISLHVRNNTWNPSRQIWSLLLENRNRCDTMQMTSYSHSVRNADLPLWSTLTSLDMEFIPSAPTIQESILDLTDLSGLKSYTERTWGNAGIKVYLPLATLQSLEVRARRDWLHAQLGHAPALTKLYVQNDSGMPWPSTSNVWRDASFPALREAVLIDSEAWLPAVSQSTLTVLTLKICYFAYFYVPTYMASLTDVVTRARAQLENLDVGGDGNWRDVLWRKEIAQASSLRSLQIRIPITPGLMGPSITEEKIMGRLGQDYISWLVDLQRPSVCTSLQHLLVHCVVTGNLRGRCDVRVSLEESILLRLLRNELRRIDANRPGCCSGINLYFDGRRGNQRWCCRWRRDGGQDDWIIEPLPAGESGFTTF